MQRGRCRRAHGVRRPGSPGRAGPEAPMRAVALAALLAASTAFAQTVVQLKPPPPPEPPIGFMFELKMGTLIPRVGDEPGLSSNPYETIFGNKSMLFGGGEIDFIAWPGYGAV